MRDSNVSERQRIRSLSVDSTTQAVQDAAEKSDHFNTFMSAAADAAHDFRRKPSRQNSYIEAVKQIGGKLSNLILNLLIFLGIFFDFIKTKKNYILINYGFICFVQNLFIISKFLIHVRLLN